MRSYLKLAAAAAFGVLSLAAGRVEAAVPVGQITVNQLGVPVTATFNSTTNCDSSGSMRQCNLNNIINVALPQNSKTNPLQFKFSVDTHNIVANGTSGAGYNAGQLAANTYAAIAQNLQNNGVNGIYSISFQVPAGLTITLTAQVVPLPAAAVLFGSALVGLGGLGLRRRSRGLVPA